MIENNIYGYIYKTINLINYKIYIGQKKARKFLGNSYLGSGKTLKKAINKYGKENFKVELLELITDPAIMDSREIYWISYYQATNKEIGYNISTGGNVNRTMLGEHNPMYHKHHSKATKEKISKNQHRSKEGKLVVSTVMKARQAGAGNIKARAVVQLTMQLEVVAIFKTIREAAISLNLDKKLRSVETYINHVCAHIPKHNSAYGYK